MDYSEFLNDFDEQLSKYNDLHSNFLQCMKGCSLCCKKGDYPLSQLEFEYLMQGYIALNDEKKKIVQNNIKSIKKSSVCPFLYSNECILYEYRPIVCRVHGLAYKGNKAVIVPFCANIGKNYSSVYKSGYINCNPIPVNLDTPSVLEGFEYGEIRSMYEWFKI